ncbi:hypothetical protein [Conchiformibius kuhniae]|uniref:Uncharacterized protein n=1 Tax=Conchiformibius kuhniae TaxID=211502 RepID=A0A8T9MT35_9NEIS|nr:hypothetical protein [Conchiformibius kuhniae]UOP04244.1 hypothetical protein LVJ77_07490 [Conchiformibius kuhniae]
MSFTDRQVWIETAVLHLENLLKYNTLIEINTPYQLTDLDHHWHISYNVLSKYSTQPVFILTDILSKNRKEIAEYRLVLDKDKRFIDEFFITY